MRTSYSLTTLIVFTIFSLVAVSGEAAEFDGVGIDVQNCVVRFADEVEVPALAAGQVAEVFVRDNDDLETGSRIVRLDDSSLLIRRRSLQLRLELARAEAADEIELQYAKIARDEAQAELDASRAVQNEFSGAIATTQLRRLKLSVTRGELEVARAEKRRSEAETAVDLAEAELSVIDDQLRKLHVQTPLTGVLLEVAKKVGEWVETGETLATVARIDRLHIHAILDSKSLAPQQCAGLPVNVHWTDPSTAESHSLRGKVLSVDPHVMPGGQYRLHAEVTNELVLTNQSSKAKSWKLSPGAEVRMKVHAPAAIANRNRTLK
jgi:multidrug resistance efflux pump